TVGKDGRELNVIHLSGPLLLVGRSPVCDAVVRVKGLKPVHFMIEWIGEGDFDPMLGSWTVFDVSGAGGTESGV
ncbi:FHA domain-containing protein, partial [Klebsiella pneumoniae]|uniref:FHA domain-containing protein n=1 Tax=Klebsiella pneumoniae TaxID=573 RepID=UPI003EE072B4